MCDFCEISFLVSSFRDRCSKQSKGFKYHKKHQTNLRKSSHSRLQDCSKSGPMNVFCMRTVDESQHVDEILQHVGISAHQMFFCSAAWK